MTEEQKKDVFAMREAGSSIYAIAKKYGVSRCKIYCILDPARLEYHRQYSRENREIAAIKKRIAYERNPEETRRKWREYQRAWRARKRAENK